MAGGSHSEYTSPWGETKGQIKARLIAEGQGRWDRHIASRQYFKNQGVSSGQLWRKATEYKDPSTGEFLFKPMEASKREARPSEVADKIVDRLFESETVWVRLERAAEGRTARAGEFIAFWLEYGLSKPEDIDPSVVPSRGALHALREIQGDAQLRKELYRVAMQRYATVASNTAEERLIDDGRDALELLRQFSEVIRLDELVTNGTDSPEGEEGYQEVVVGDDYPDTF